MSAKLCPRRKLNAYTPLTSEYIHNVCFPSLNMSMSEEVS